MAPGRWVWPGWRFWASYGIATQARPTSPAILGFVRISTHRHILRYPLPVDAACATARSWLAQPQVNVLHPGDRHGEILFGLLGSLGTAGNLTTDAHLAALAIEHQAELHSTDADFRRFPGLRWSNPLT